MNNLKETWCFIDLENLPSALKYATENNYSRIFVFVGSQQKANINNLTTNKATQIEMIKIEGTSKNNLDFHLIYYLGKCQVSAGDHVEFAIFSKDTGWDKLIKFIQKEGRICNRTGDIKKSSPNAAPKTVSNTNTLPTDVQQIINKLKNIHKDKRPKRVDKLTNHLESIIRSIDTPKTAKQIVTLFTQHGLIMIEDHNKVKYGF
ncbi:MAG: hypothetical protein DRR08_11310 [Candidatus Parabeggiatoa sp. nov. 2]|nr:MAG: hypothetical protein B6247_20290 [Beggiatoa sp. 4572_84]RKZ60438.1 MAG: hypothetical protein DRR08_11310 [Gammaproteobacteria bacterium]